MSGKKPSLGRGLAELSPLLAQRAPRRTRGIRVRRRPCWPVIAWRVCRSTCCSGASISRASTCARDLERTRRFDQGAGAGAAHPGAPAAVRAIRANRSATRSSPASGAGGRRKWRALPRFRRSSAMCPTRPPSMALIENIQREDLNPLEEAARSAPDRGIRPDPPGGGRGRRALARRGEQSAAAHGARGRGQGAAGAAQHRNGPCASAAGLTSRRQQIEVAGLVAKKVAVGARNGGLVRRLLAPRCSAPPHARRWIPTSSAWSANWPISWAPRWMFQHTRPARASWWSATTALDELEGILGAHSVTAIE
jgi:hypothetical protein